jgi:hypothetical protein
LAEARADAVDHHMRYRAHAVFAFRARFGPSGGGKQARFGGIHLRQLRRLGLERGGRLSGNEFNRRGVDQELRRAAANAGDGFGEKRELQRDRAGDDAEPTGDAEHFARLLRQERTDGAGGAPFPGAQRRMCARLRARGVMQAARMMMCALCVSGIGVTTAARVLSARPSKPDPSHPETLARIARALVCVASTLRDPPELPPEHLCANRIQRFCEAKKGRVHVKVRATKL